MTTWILIMAIYLPDDAIEVSIMRGYASKVSCEETAEKWRSRKGKRKWHRETLCIPANLK